MAYSNKVSVLRSLAAVLRKAGITSNVTVISKAKVPIVKFVTTHGRFNVDISINQTNGIIGGQVIKGFLQSTNGDGIALRSLVLITKLFLSQRSMNEVFTGGLGSYSIVCLAASFLQLHPKIRRGEIDPEKNLGVLVMEFFELYGCHFNYDEVGISIRDGGTYFSKRLRGWYDSNRRDCLSVEDPVDPCTCINSAESMYAQSPSQRTIFPVALSDFLKYALHWLVHIAS
jgi:non-canonical poly(A) RNA polymerase PAPD5/7